MNKKQEQEEIKLYVYCHQCEKRIGVAHSDEEARLIADNHMEEKGCEDVSWAEEPNKVDLEELEELRAKYVRTGRVHGVLIESDNPESADSMLGRCSLCGQSFYYEKEWETHNCLEDMDEEILKFALQIQKNFNIHKPERGDWKKKDPELFKLLDRFFDELTEFFETANPDEMADVGAFACWIFTKGGSD